MHMRREIHVLHSVPHSVRQRVAGAGHPLSHLITPLPLPPPPHPSRSLSLYRG